MARKATSAAARKKAAEKDVAKAEKEQAQAKKKIAEAAAAADAAEKEQKKAQAKQRRAELAAKRKAAADEKKAKDARESAEKMARIQKEQEAEQAKWRAALEKARDKEKKAREVVIGAEGGVRTAIKVRRNPDKGYKRRAYVGTRGKLDDGDVRVAYPGENKKHPRDVYVSDRGNFFKVYGAQGE